MTAGSFRTPPSRYRQSPCHNHRQTFLSSHRHHITACGLGHIQSLPYRQPSSSATRIVLPPYPAILDTCPKTVSTITKSRLSSLNLVTVPKMPNLSLTSLKPSCHPQHDMRDAVLKYAIAHLNK